MKHLASIREKMETAGLPDVVIESFIYYYKKLLEGDSGLISDRDIVPVSAADLKPFEGLQEFAEAGRNAAKKAVIIKLNGGLGTSMGLSTAKSLLPIKENLSFLDIIIEQAEFADAKLVLMNSFNTDRDTRLALERIGPKEFPEIFLQHKFPKILQKDFTPARWPENPAWEWNPPGHGDIYTALNTSETLDRLLADGIEFAFISNSDNLGAVLEPALLGFFAEGGFPFMMEVAQRTPSDTKGGHLALKKEGGLILREIAQCPAEEVSAFTDISIYRYFNTNNIWINLRRLKRLLSEIPFVPLSLILNPKHLNPKDEQSPLVFQIETAMGSAISLFKGSCAVLVPKNRLIPVKKCNDLLAVRSDYTVYTPDKRLLLNPERVSDGIKISLDPKYYGDIDSFDARFPSGVPSLKNCMSVSVSGDVRFDASVVLKGDVTIKNSSDSQVVIPSGTVLDSDLHFQ